VATWFERDEVANLTKIAAAKAALEQDEAEQRARTRDDDSNSSVPSKPEHHIDGTPRRPPVDEQR
jgi:hypothetical protein